MTPEQYDSEAKADEAPVPGSAVTESGAV